MTAAASPTQVRCTPDELLTAHCRQCGVDLVQVPETDVGAALAALDAAHPAGGRAEHAADPPAGWRALIGLTALTG